DQCRINKLRPAIQSNLETGDHRVRQRGARAGAAGEAEAPGVSLHDRGSPYVAARYGGGGGDGEAHARGDGEQGADRARLWGVARRGGAARSELAVRIQRNGWSAGVQPVAACDARGEGAGVHGG